MNSTQGIHPVDGRAIDSVSLCHKNALTVAATVVAFLVRLGEECEVLRAGKQRAGCLAAFHVFGLVLLVCDEPPFRALVVHARTACLKLLVARNVRRLVLARFRVLALGAFWCYPRLG